MPERITREIVFTGGPCGGKTTALGAVSDHLRSLGWRVLVVPETATTLISAGITDIGDLVHHGGRRWVEVERAFLASQRATEAAFRKLAEALGDDRTVLLYDRGCADIAAYLPPEWFEAMLEDERLTFADVRDTYDAVLHLVTAADGAEHAYTLANNAARTETPERARELDGAVLDAWMGHPHLTVIDNSAPGGFEAKLQRVIDAVVHALGTPNPTEIERKWLLEAPPSEQQLRDAGAVPVDIEQIYLVSDGPAAERRIRRRHDRGGTTYTMTIKGRPSADGLVRSEVESPIDAVTFRELAQTEADPARQTLHKRRWHLHHDGQMFEVDQVLDPVIAWYVEAELREVGQQVALPAWLGPAREVTGHEEHKAATLARLQPQAR